MFYQVKWPVMMLLAVAAVGPVQAADMVGAVADGVAQASHALTCSLFAHDKGATGKAIQRSCVRQAQQDFARQPDRRTLQDCIKPGNLIDDDVRNCMKGL
ncbi:hypothetical protein RAM80_00670 [Pseudomonas sp. App30]|uniref:hypothetical protein n=1 Tax=Pseudomonas sp. App30 TaxID=3068990 RepID=UPI003A80E48E